MLRTDNDYILQLRTSISFKIYVIHFDIIAIITFLLSVKVYKILRKKKVFSAPTTFLLNANLFFANIHNIIYFIIENWSFYRSIIYSLNAHLIMFNNVECYSLHILSSCARVCLIFAEISLCLERIFVILFPKLCENIFYAYALSILAFVCSYLFAFLLHLLRPAPDVLTTSCFREQDLIIDLYSSTLMFYTISAICCMILDGFVVLYSILRQKIRVFDLKSRYQMVEQFYSLLAVSIFSLIHMTFTVFYAIFMFIFNQHQTSDFIDANFVRWFYPTTYILLALPIELLILMKWISMKRKKKIQTCKTIVFDQKRHFEQLEFYWKRKAICS